ncbi:MAG: lectin-like domain-containing protein [Breznakia sp.]
MKLLQNKKIYKKACIAFMVMCMVATSFVMTQSINAMPQDEAFLSTTLTYHEAGATINFDMESIDQEKYEIESITSKRDDVTIYEEAMSKDIDIAYEVYENGTYYFNVQYYEKNGEAIENELLEQSKNSIEQAMGESEIKAVNLEVCVDELEKTPEENIEVDLREKTLDESDKIRSSVSSDYYNPNDIDLRSSFNLSGIKGNINQPYGWEPDAIYENSDKYDYYTPYRDDNGIQKNGIIMGNRNAYTDNSAGGGGWDQQVVTLTSKKQLNYGRSFVMEGRMNLSSEPEGFAIAFHHTKNFVAGTEGGALGVYYDDDGHEGFQGNREGVHNAVVAEIDTKRNRSNYAGSNDYADRNGPNGEQHHMQINKTDNLGHALKISDTKYWKQPSSTSQTNDPFNQMASYKIEWNRSASTIQFTIDWNAHGSDSNVYQVSANIPSEFSKTPGYYTISSAINYRLDVNNDNYPYKRENYFWIDAFEYLDEDISFDTNFTTFASTNAQIGNQYAIPEEEIIVTHEIYNKKNLSYDIDYGIMLDLKPFFLNEIKRDDIEIIDKDTGGIKVGTNINDLQTLPVGGINEMQQLRVIYPANGKKYYVQYKIKIPYLSNYGQIDQLKNAPIVGEEGWKQTPTAGGVLSIWNKPALFTKASDGSEKSVFDVMHIEDKSSDTSALFEVLRKSLYGKIAPEVQQSLSSGIKKEGLEDGKPLLLSNLKMSYQYTTNFPEHISAGLPPNIDNSKIYSLAIEVSDARDKRLSNTFKRHVGISDAMKNSGLGYLFSNTQTPSKILETELSTWKESNFVDNMARACDVNAFRVDAQSGNMVRRLISADSSGWINSRGYVDKNPGNYKVHMIVGGYVGLETTIDVQVVENMWDYEDSQTSANGQYGYIVIPKSITLKKDPMRKYKIIAKEKIAYLDYNSDKQYQVVVNETFDLHSKDRADKILVTTKADGTHESDNKLSLGKIGNSAGASKELNFSLEADIDEEKKQYQWSGILRFTFSLIP